MTECSLYARCGKIWRSGGKLQKFLNSAQDRTEWTKLHSSPFTPVPIGQDAGRFPLPFLLLLLIEPRFTDRSLSLNRPSNIDSVFTLTLHGGCVETRDGVHATTALSAANVGRLVLTTGVFYSAIQHTGNRTGGVRYAQEEIRRLEKQWLAKDLVRC